MKNKKIVIIVIVLVIIFGIIVINSNNTGGDEETIKIGSILILTGDGASWGEAEVNGINLAISEINNDGGVNGKKLEVIHEDGKADPKEALSAFRKLTNINNVEFIIGTTWSLSGIPLIKVADEAGVVMISPSLGVADFNEGSDYLFNLYPHDSILSEELAEYVFGKGYKNVALFGAKDPWVTAQSEAFTNHFEEIGGRVVVLVEPVVGKKDLRTEVLKIKENPSVEAVVMTTDGFSLTPIGARQMQELGVNQPKFSITLDSRVIGDCGDACDGMQFMSFLTPTKEFEEKYIRTYNREVEIGADSAYDIVMLLAKAMRETGSTDPDVVKDYLNKVRSYSGVSGELIADGKGGFVKDYVINEIYNSTWSTIK